MPNGKTSTQAKLAWKLTTVVSSALTNSCVPTYRIFAIGDIVGQPMLAHKGVHEGHVAAEVIAGKKHYFDPKVIPSIAYTEPEVAWVGLTEKEAKEKGISYETATFPCCFWSCYRFRLRRRDQADFRQRISPCDRWCDCRH